jgi:guanylate kinase
MFMLFVISAPSGAGKTTIIRELFNILPGLRFSVSATTRPKRKIEKEGKDYYFISKQEFEDRVKKDDFAEWEEVHGQLYGTLKGEIEKSLTDGLNSGVDMVFDVDVKGAVHIKKLYPEAVSIFIDAPRDELIKRLKKRSTETDDEIKKRLTRLDLELSYKNKFDYIVQNNSSPDGIKKAVNKIVNIITKSKGA